jgi:hypothetical protein
MAWKLDHGALPERLEELEGRELPRLPVDPITGGPILYYPDGMPVDVNFAPRAYHESATLAANRPFIWMPTRPQGWPNLVPQLRIAPVDQSSSGDPFAYQMQGSVFQADREQRGAAS